jgi:hypothetical protein
LVGFSSVRIDGREALGFGFAPNESFEVTDCFRGQEGVSADVAVLSRDILEDENFAAFLDSVNDLPGLVVTGTSFDAAFHDLGPLSDGDRHLGGFGS